MVGKTSEDVETGRTPRSISTHQSWHSVTSTASASYVTTNANAPISVKPEIEVKQEMDTHDLDTIYGTYDEATNSVTIIYPGDDSSVGIQECVQEVVTDGVSSIEESSHLTPNCYSNQLSPSYTSMDSMSPSSIHSEDMDTNVTVDTSIALDSSASDCGYESHGSPTPDVRNEKCNVNLTDLWHESFTELFPTLA